MNDKIDMLEAEHGLTGFSVYIKLLQLIYQTDAGELDMSNVFRWKTLGKKWELAEETLRKLVDTMCEIGLFDKNILEKRQALTSTGVQKRLGKVAGLREKDRLRHGKGGSDGAEAFSHGKPLGNAGKSTQKESKEKVNTTAVAAVGARATASLVSQVETPRPLELPADEAPVFTQAGFSAFVKRMQYGHINIGRYLIDIQRGASKLKNGKLHERTNEGWENYILEWLKRDSSAGHLLLAESIPIQRPTLGSAPLATVATSTYNMDDLIANQSKPSI